MPTIEQRITDLCLNPRCRRRATQGAIYLGVQRSFVLCESCKIYHLELIISKLLKKGGKLTLSKVEWANETAFMEILSDGRLIG